MKRILVISQDGSTKKAFAALLKKLGCNAASAASLQEASERFEKGFDAILIDARAVAKPGLRAQDLNEHWGGIPLVVLVEEGMEANARKPGWPKGAVIIPRAKAKDLLAPVINGLSTPPGGPKGDQAVIQEMLCEQERLESLIKEKSEMLEESLLNYYTVVEHIQDGVAIIQEQRIIFTNKRFCSMLGYDQKALHNKDAKLILPPEVCDLLVRQDPLNSPQSTRLHEIHVLTKGAVLLPVELNVEHTVYNKMPSTLLFMKDITDRKKLQTKLIHTSNMAAIGQIAIGLAHDLNTPLANISLLAENISSKTSDENILQKLNTIHDQVDAITNTIKNLVVFYRRSKDLTSDININEVVLDALDRAKDLLTHNLDVELKLDDAMPAVRGNQDQMSQVFLNIILNADDAMEDEGVLIIRTSHDDGRVYVEFEDNGCGIPEEKLPQIFDAFYTTKKPNKGVGLGLSICQGIVHAHSGKISVSSKLGKGTTLKIALKR